MTTRSDATLLDTVILIALPASGKSEVRKYLESLPPERCRSELHLGPTVQLDDFPYVHMFRRIDAELARLGRASIFFRSPDRPFANPLDWGTLIELLNEDYARLAASDPFVAQSPAALLFDRIDAARAAVGGGRPLASLSTTDRAALAAALEPEARDLLEKQAASHGGTLEGRTVVIEFARGGRDGASMPLPPPFGYAYSLSRLSRPILERATILYIWVTPEESRRKNVARANPADPGSILHHGVPLDVMLNDYGCDDVEHLLGKSSEPDTVTIDAHGRSFVLPLVRFDNRADKTSFVRKPRSEWTDAEVRALHDELARCFGRLAARQGGRR